MQVPAKLFTSLSLTQSMSLRKCSNIFPNLLHRHVASATNNPCISRNSPNTHPACSNFSHSKRTLIHASRYAPVDIPNEDIFTFLSANLPHHESNVAAIDAPTGRQCTHRELHRGAVSLGSALIKRGIQPGDVVGMCAPNCVEYMMAMMAVTGIGCTLSPINQSLYAHEMEAQMIMTQTKILITTDEFLPVVNEAVAGTGGVVKEIIVVGESTSPSLCSFASLLGDEGSAFPSEAERRAMIDPASHVAFIPFSSGTTGMPKGVELTHRNIIANIVQASTYEDVTGGTSYDRALSVLPMWHVYMLLGSLMTLRRGSMACIMPKFEPVLFLKSIAEHRLSYLPLVPPLGIFLLEYKDLVAKYDLSCVQDFLFGAAPLGPDTHAQICEKFAISRVRQAWGMSELSPGATIAPCSEPLPGSAGVLLPNTEMKIVDINDRSVLGAGREGEIAVRGPQVMKGYLNNPKATLEMIDSEGWLYTGDIGHVDPHGHLRIIDRLKELIKYKGHQVAPAELEDVLISHPDIADAAVIGIPVEAVGEVPRAFVKLKADCNVSEQHVVDYVNARVGAFSWLRGGAEFVDAIPKAPSGKILRRELREKHKKESALASASS